MTCASFVAHVEKALKGVDGVDDARVNLATNNATIDFDPSFASPAVLEKAIADAGYEPQDRRWDSACGPGRAPGDHDRDDADHDPRPLPEMRLEEAVAKAYAGWEPE